MRRTLARVGVAIGLALGLAIYIYGVVADDPERLLAGGMAIIIALLVDGLDQLATIRTHLTRKDGRTHETPVG
jgi:hypothetical protein